MAEGAEIARAYVLVVPSLQGAQKELTKELVPEAESAAHEAGTKGGEKFKKAMSAAAKASVAVMAAAVGASIKLIKESLDAYAESEQLTGGIEKLFGDAADAVLEASKEAYRTAGMSANDYLQQVTGISAALLNSGISAEEAAQKADEAMRQIADNANTFGRLSAEELGNVYGALARGSYQVLDQLSLGYAGSKTGLKQLIADANAYAKATGRAADLTEDNFADIVTAIGLVQEKTGIAETTIKEAEGTISGSLSMLSASWQNLVAGLGDPAADVEELVGNVMTSLQSAVKNITPVIQRIAKSLTTALPSIVQQVAAMLPVVLPDILEAVVTLATSVAEELPGILETLITVITNNSELFIGAAITIALALVNAVPRLIDVLADAIPKILVGEDGNGGIIGELTKPEHQEEFVLGAIKIATALVKAVPRIILPLIQEAPNIVRNLVSAFQTPESQEAFAAAGRELGAALWSGVKALFPSDWWKLLLPGGGSFIDTTKRLFGGSNSTPATPIDLGGYDGLTAQTNISIGNMTVAAPSSGSANALFDAVRRAAAQG